MTNEKTTRIPNFSPAEKEYLMQIAMRYSTILEDKKTNKAGLEEKTKVWKKIEAEFNSTAPILAFRNQDQLKRLYENKKKDLRKKMADHKKKTYLTGGGPAPADLVLDNVENMLLLIINEKSVRGFYSEFDSDNLDQENNTEIAKPLNENCEQRTIKKKETEEQEAGNNPEENIKIFEFVPHIPTESENIAAYDNFSPGPNYLSDRCPPTGLQKPINSKLLPNSETITSAIVNIPTGSIRKNKTSCSDRRRPVGGLRALTSSDVGEKYNILLDRRLVLIEKQLEHTIESKNLNQEEQKQKMKILKLEEDKLNLEKEEKLLKIELLKSEIHYKRSFGTTI